MCPLFRGFTVFKFPAVARLLSFQLEKGSSILLILHPPSHQSAKSRNSMVLIAAVEAVLVSLQLKTVSQSLPTIKANLVRNKILQ